MYGEYDSSNNVTIINDRSSEGLADANIRIGNIKCDIAELEIKLQAIYRVMLDQGIDPKLFEDKIEEIMKERAEAKPKPVQELVSKPCPKCGRAVRKNANNPLLGKCMYCSTSVPFYPTFMSKEETD